MSSTEKKKDEKEKKPVKLEEVAEETGELVGKGIKKAWNVTKSFGKGLADTLEEGEEKKDTSSSPCPHCGASIPSDSKFCASCGKKL